MAKIKEVVQGKYTFRIGDLVRVYGRKTIHEILDFKKDWGSYQATVIQKYTQSGLPKIGAKPETAYVCYMKPAPSPRSEVKRALKALWKAKKRLYKEKAANNG